MVEIETSLRSAVAAGRSLRAAAWGPVGYITYKRTYARPLADGGTEEFPDTVERTVGACRKQLRVGFTEQEDEELRDAMYEMRGLPAGRFLWQLGTETVDRLGLLSLQNCFAPETEFMTKAGIKKFSDFQSGDLVTIRGRDSWKAATVRSYGKQYLCELTVRKGKSQQTIRTTANHRWIKENNSVAVTEELRPGDVLKSFRVRTNFHHLSLCPIGLQHGIVYGDGNWNENAKACAITLCGEKEELRKAFYPQGQDDTKTEINALPYFWKDLPDVARANKHYLLGFLAGWFAADGSVSEQTGTLTLCSSNLEALQWARGAFSRLCITTGNISVGRLLSPFTGNVAPSYKLTIHRETLPRWFLLRKRHQENYKEVTHPLKWKVVDVRMSSVESEVWCVQEPESEEFTLANGILTKNCAFTVVDDPIRPFTWTMDCLMLGCGVGYNIQREFVYKLPRPMHVTVTRQDTKDADFIVPDTREGWVELLRKTLEAHFVTGKDFTYSCMLIRSKDALIKGFGGRASGPDVLCWGIAEISKLLNTRAHKNLRSVDCLDIMNIIGYIVVAGNVRRSAQIAIGDCDDLLFLRAKRWDLGNIPAWRAMSNNSVVCNDLSLLPEEFWEGYRGNGEPYGLINLRMLQTVGRTGRAADDSGVLGVNPCVAGNTQILTDKGYVRIDALVGKKVNIWNGFEWSQVEPRITGHNRKMVTVRLSDGRELRCTENHEWVVVSQYGKYQNQARVKAAQLVPGTRLLKVDMPVVHAGLPLEHAYSQGLYSAEGSADSNILWLYSPKFVCESRLTGVLSSGNEYPIRGSNVTRKELRLVGDMRKRGKTYVPLDCDLPSRLSWLAGLLDGDGAELKEGGAQICSVDFEFLLKVQKMLTTMGVASKVVDAHGAGLRAMPDGQGGTREYYCSATYRLCIGAIQMQFLKNLGLQCERLSFKKSPQRDASQFVRVLEVKESGVEDTVYCFTEPKRNLGCFEGIVTGQCAEQGLEPYETCCLGEIFLPNCTSYAQFLQTARLLYRICKHSLRLPCHHPETEAVVHANMRMGLGVTGYMQATAEQKSWLGRAAVDMQVYDMEYSAHHGFPPSIKLLTVKPSGTLSLLAGVTPGAHPGFAQFHIRRIRMDARSELVEVCRQHGFQVEQQKRFDGTDDSNTVVVEFPCAFPEGTVLAADMTAVDQLETIKKLQTEWSDNAVSCTIYYKLEELPAIREWLQQNYSTNIKSCSFLLHSGHGFVQAPLEAITHEEYLRRKKSTRDIVSVSIGEQVLLDADCESGSCPIR